MAENHFVRIVKDGTLATEAGWVFADCEDAGQIVFAVEESALMDEVKLNRAWVAARELVIEQAVREGRVQWVKRPGEGVDELRDAVISGHGGEAN